MRPDIAVSTPHGPTRLGELARTGRPLLLDLTDGGAAAEALSDLRSRVDLVPARAGSPAPAGTVLLVRPDSYVAWASSAPRPGPEGPAGLRAAAERWFGAPAERAG
ncbi:hypothetical protein ACFQXA_10070 [Nocardiopsis composta]